VIFGDGATATNGTIDLLMVNSARFRVRPTGIAYTEFKDGQPGKSVFVAELQSSSAELTGSTEVTYVAALGSADLRYDLSLAGLEQNVVFRQRPPRAQDLQMAPALVRIECWNEVVESPPPATSVSTLARADGSVDQDTQLDFGPMQVNIGRAYAINGAPDARSLRVAKQWQAISNSVYLIESVPYLELAPLLNTLPAQQASRSIDSRTLRELWAKRSNGTRSRPLSVPELRSAQAKSRNDTGRTRAPARAETRVATVNRAPSLSTSAVIWDWSLLASSTNATLQGDTTYYVSGPVTLSSTGNGATVIEGGTVVKFTNSTTTARITILGPILCLASAYRPAVFTSKDSDDVGEKISGSTGSPTDFYGQGLEFGGTNSLSNLRFAWLSTALEVDQNGVLNLADAQFVNCRVPLYGHKSDHFQRGKRIVLLESGDD